MDHPVVCSVSWLGVVMPKVAKLSVNVTTVLGLNPSPMTLRGTNTYLIGGGTGKRQVPKFLFKILIHSFILTL